jgi:hypothetical protein
MARQALKMLMGEHQSNKREGKAKTRMVRDQNILSGADKRPPMEVAAASMRHGLRSVFRPEMVRHGAEGSAAITNGAQAPDERAPDVSEEPSAIAAEKETVEGPQEVEGPGGWKYRVYPDERVEVIGGPEGKSKATPEKPVPLQPEQAKKVRAEIGNFKKVDVGPARDKSGSLYQHAEAGAPAIEPPSKGEFEAPSSLHEKASSRLEMLSDDKDAEPDDLIADPQERPAEEQDFGVWTEEEGAPPPKDDPKSRRLRALQDEGTPDILQPENDAIPSDSATAPFSEGSAGDAYKDGPDDEPEGEGGSPMEAVGSTATKMGEAGRKAMAPPPVPAAPAPASSTARDQERQAAIADPKRRRRYELLYGLD